MKKIILSFSFIVVCILIVLILFIGRETYTIKDILKGEDELPIMLVVESNRLINPTFELAHVAIVKETVILSSRNEKIEHTALETDMKIIIKFLESLISILPGTPVEYAETIKVMN